MNTHAPNRQPPITNDDLREDIRRADEEGTFISSEKVHEWMRSLDSDPDAPFPEPDVFKK